MNRKNNQFLIIWYNSCLGKCVLIERYIMWFLASDSTLSCSRAANNGIEIWNSNTLDKTL